MEDIMGMLSILALGAAGLAVVALAATAETDPARAVVEMERKALERWGKGDPMGFVEIADADIVYFDPGLEVRIDGRNAFMAYMEGIRGKVKLDRFELLNPKVQLGGDLAVLTFNYVSCLGTTESRWNSTEVYRRTEAGWRLIESHWSRTRPAC